MTQPIRLEGELGAQGQRRHKTFNKAEFDKKRKHEREYVRGIFRNYENPGSQVVFYYRGSNAKKGDPVLRYTMMDGVFYEIPRGVARHINQNCRYKVQETRVDSMGKEHPFVGRYINRYGFNSADTDVSEQSNILVEPNVIVGPADL